MIGQSLVAFPLLIDQEDSLQESVRVEPSWDPPQSVGTGQRFAQPLFPEAGGGELGQSVEAGQARPEHDQSRFDHGGGGTDADPVCNLPGEPAASNPGPFNPGPFNPGPFNPGPLQGYGGWRWSATWLELYGSTS
jgi:hypothetical protein